MLSQSAGMDTGMGKGPETACSAMVAPPLLSRHGPCQHTQEARGVCSYDMLL